MALLLLFLLPSNGTALNIQTKLLERLPQLSDESDNSDISLRTIESLLEDAKEVVVEDDLGSEEGSVEADATEVVSKCPKCSGGPALLTEQDKTALRAMRIEMVKAQILVKLQLESPPVIASPRQVLPDEVTQEFMRHQAPVAPKKRDTTNIIVANKRKNKYMNIYIYIYIHNEYHVNAL